jgi:hypothetical protein
VRARRSTHYAQRLPNIACRRLRRVVGRVSLALVMAGAAGPATARQTAPPALALVLTDHHFRLSAPVERGRLLWQVKNEGSEPHQALVVKLPDGVNEYQERAWFEHGSKGDEPGRPIGGLETLAPGAEASFQTDLTPGRYLLLCAMAEDEGRHYELGMIYRFTIE